MSEKLLSTIRQLELMRDVQRLANERREKEQRLRQTLQARLAAAEQQRDRQAREIDRQFETSRDAAQAEYEQRCAVATARYESERQSTQQKYQGYRAEVESTHQQATRSALAEQQEAAWETWTLFEAQKDAPRQRLAEALQRLGQSNQALAVLEHEAQHILKSRWLRSVVDQAGDGAEAESPGSPTGDDQQSNSAGEYVEAAADLVDDLVADARQQATRLDRISSARLFEGGNPAAAVAVLWLISLLPCGLAIGWTSWVTYALATTVALVGTASLMAWLYPVARRQSTRQYEQVQQALANARRAIEAAATEARQRSRQEAETLLQRRNATLAAANDQLLATTGETDQWKSTELSDANRQFPELLARLRQDFETEMTTAESQLRENLSEAADERDRASAENRESFQAESQSAQADFDADWRAMADQWQAGLADARQVVADMNRASDSLFPDWSHTDYGPWQPPDKATLAIQFGHVDLDLTQVKHGRPDDPRLVPSDPVLRLPAVMNLEEHPLMVIEADGTARERAVELLELMVLRFLTALPPGKVRLTILDPVGLGENFASFMHLADFDERLIASRIWTEPKDISEQLLRLTTHMETILQKYLRNEFATIHEYNEHAGEVAEPFQVLVVANFPANFTDESARRLLSIATSGPRCGVFTLLSIDRNQRKPNDFRRDDLLERAVHLDWQAEREDFVWRYPAFERLPLALDRAPPDERFNEVVRQAGRAAQRAIHVEVPFRAVAPNEGEFWNEDSGAELVVPIGRAGATRLQQVRLGKGTSQHLLICGKTGSGKSTFLHALVTNAALRYSPDEVEFYLVDFKKGVEFKCYATANLPHARVIAIESEREFGLSVLEKLDDELRRRGDLFRSLGVQDLSAFRQAQPREQMPRVLLIIDEFQELFVEDDKLAQDAGLLLDRLVRQGRAFGMHVLLGSQTLSGAYSLARSTMGQMAVRVALQCSEADAHLILNDERNPAARYLNRPGEAIYNDQNGLLVGNSPFQVVWLGEQERYDYLHQVEGLQGESGQASAPAIVFEGNTPADPQSNSQLAALLESPADTAPGTLQKAWLGAAVAIKEPTCATFARHAGSNMLVVGHREEAALGALTTAAISLAAQNAGMPGAGNPAEPQHAAQDKPVENPQPAFHKPQLLVLDGTRPDSPEAGTWQRVAEALPGGIEVHQLRETASIVSQLAAELSRREAAGRDDDPSIYLVIYNGGRFRELRRTEDDFSFSVDRDKPPSPDKQLGEILKNGPAWGIHTMVWCDSYNNVTRMFDRMALREFEMRVAFQMSAADSTSLLDTPAAARLVVHRGLFYSDETGTAEKFRPYGPPSEQWLARVRGQLAR